MWVVHDTAETYEDVSKTNLAAGDAHVFINEKLRMDPGMQSYAMQT